MISRGSSTDEKVDEVVLLKQFFIIVSNNGFPAPMVSSA
jgi:hypothetical protein